MKELLAGRIVKIVIPALTGLSAGTTVAVNVQRVNLSQAGYELGRWSVILGGITLMLVSALFLGMVVFRGRRLFEQDRLVRLLCYGAAFVVISVGLSLCGWAIVAAGLLPWAAAQSAILAHIAVPVYLMRLRGRESKAFVRLVPTSASLER